MGRTLLRNIILILLGTGTVQAQTTLTSRQSAILDSIATRDVPRNAPGIATAIIENSRVIYQKYAGYANLEDSLLIGDNTRFNIASNGKQFTALAVLTLIGSGKLQLTDDIRTYFPDLFPAIKEKIPVQSLLNHTSGIRDCYDLWNLQGYTWWKQTFSNEDVLQLISRQKELNFSPNTQYLYSNTNYILLAMLIEKVSGKSFVSYTNDMFRKLNMPHTSFEADHNNIRGPIAKPYFNFGKWSNYKWIWNACGDGNIFTTLNDQVQWERLVQGKGKTKISRTLIAKSQQVINGSSFTNYGYGLEFGTYKKINYTFHEGATGAWKATVIRFPGRRLSLLTLTNTGKSIPAMQTRQMADVVLQLQSDAAYLVTQPARVGNFVSDDEIIGTYLTPGDFAFRFEKKNNAIFLKRNGRNDVELEREADNIFHQKYDPLFKQEFTRDSTGNLQVTAYYINHSPYTLTKQITDFTGFVYSSLEGDFINDETDVVMSIRHKSGNDYLVILPTDDSTTGLLITPGKMLVGNYTLSIDTNSGTANVAVLYLNGERIKRVRFVRKGKG